MATEVQCGIPGCQRRYLPGHGGRGGKKPRCSMHLSRERRKSKRAEEPGQIVGGEDRSERVTINCSTQLKRWLERQAKRSSISEVVVDVLEARRLESRPV